jgi:surface protein
MFKEASAFDQPLNQWDTGKVTNMQEMFSKATSYNQDLTGWQVGQVTQCLFFSFGATSWSSSNQPTSFTCALAP